MRDNQLIRSLKEEFEGYLRYSSSRRIELAQKLLEEIDQEEVALTASIRSIRFDNALKLARALALAAARDELPNPPSGACFLLDVFLAKADRAVLAGDLREEFTTSILPKYGTKRARLWFWTQTVRTIATRNPVCRWILVGGLVRLGEWIFRKIGA
jgi:hypothetical protein